MNNPKMTIEEFRVWLEARTVTDGDCQLWNRAFNGVPNLHFKGKSVSVRNQLMKLLGHNMKGKVAVATCGNPRCVAEDHVKPMTIGQAHSFHWHVSQRRRTDKAVAALREYSRRKARVTEAEVLKIRSLKNLGLKPAQIAKEHFPHLGRSYISDICRGKRWAKVDNPWHQLMQFAANADQLRKRA